MRSLSLLTDRLRAVFRIAPAAATLFALLAAPAIGQEAASSPPPPPPGFPPGLDWKFNFDGTIGTFGFANSLYTNPKPEEPSGDLTDNWLEGALKPAVSGQYTTASSAQFYGKLSGVGERTYGASPPLVGGDASSFDVEDLYVGWRSGTSIGHGENELDFTLGRAPYQVGHGLLLMDGASEGGSRGGYWTNARKAFKFAAIGRYKPGNSTFEAFYLEKNDLPEVSSHSKVWGANYEYAIGEDTTLGATYLKWSADANVAPQRDGLDVYNLRAYTAPFAKLKALSFEAEYALEQNGTTLDSKAWNVLAAYQLQTKWMPKVSYRYAIFEGDNPTTAKNEGFDGLLTGFYDWGTWWQGEIAGEYFVSNSNLISHQFRVHATPSESIGTGLILYGFQLDHPASLGPQVTSKDVAKELDWYMD
ncbi:MAG TPA: hypothetical protein VMU03_06340, partial [Gammaproteobacteria bacterium]|nr:hypothetical protein [Gammaproteobacteria bacterium]